MNANIQKIGEGMYAMDGESNLLRVNVINQARVRGIEITDEILSFILPCGGVETVTSRGTIIFSIHKDLMMARDMKTEDDLRVYAEEYGLTTPDAEVAFFLLEKMTYRDMQKLGITHVNINHKPRRGLLGDYKVSQYSLEPNKKRFLFLLSQLFPCLMGFHLRSKAAYSANDALNENGATIFLKL